MRWNDLFKTADVGEKAGGSTRHRTRTALETLERVRPFLWSLGITRISNVTGMDALGIPTVVVVRPNSRSFSTAQGKGADLDAAKASGVMEAAELFHAEHVRVPLRLATSRELRDGGDVVDVSLLPRFVRPFDSDTRTLWIEGTDVWSSGPVWVPFEMVHLDFTLPLPTDSGYFLPGSSGLASGNHPLEAFNHGVCELIERDATTLFYDLPAHVQWERRIDLNSIQHVTCRELLQKYDEAGIDVAVWDTTSDVGAPTFLCSVIDRVTNPFRPIGVARGAGCHPSRETALARALCEAAQSRLTRIVGSRDIMQPGELDAATTDERIELNRAQIQLPPGERPPRPFERVQSFEGRTLVEDTRWLCERLRQADQGQLRQLVCVDLSQAKFPFHVVRVIIPGLEALSEVPHYQPGRRAAEARKRL